MDTHAEDKNYNRWRREREYAKGEIDGELWGIYRDMKGEGKKKQVELAAKWWW